MTDLSEIKAAFSENAETVNKSITALRAETAELLARIEDMETSSTRPGLTIEKGETRETREHKKLFESWLRKPRDSHTKQALGDFQHTMSKAMNITTGLMVGLRHRLSGCVRLNVWKKSSAPFAISCA